jgi:hypothetical protein
MWRVVSVRACENRKHKLKKKVCKREKQSESRKINLINTATLKLRELMISTHQTHFSLSLIPSVFLATFFFFIETITNDMYRYTLFFYIKTMVY